MALKLLRVAHVNLSVDDLDAASDFYGRVLGLKPALRPDDASTRPGLWFRLGDVEIHLSLEAGADNARSKRHVAFEVADADEARAQLAEMGVAVDSGKQMSGVRRFFVRDPAGNRLELFERARR